MMKQTHDSLYREPDTANAISRDFLSLKKNSDEIYFVMEEREEEEEASPKRDATISPAVGSEAPQQTTSSTPAPVLSSSPPEDAPVQPEEIIRAIICIALKKPAKDVAFDRSIRSLAGGK
jgi:fatty acid synthase subunit alpha